MNRLLNPAIQLMDRLDYSRKFAFLGLLYGTAAAVVLVALVNGLQRTLDQLAQERQGNAQLALISHAIHDLQLHRSLSAAVLGAQQRRPATTPGAQAARAAMELDAASSLRQMREALPSAVVDSETLAGADADWQQIRNTGMQWSVPDNTKAHSALIARLLRLEVLVADRYGLAYDADAGTHDLIDVAVNKLPSVLESLDRIRADGAGITAGQGITPARQAQWLYLIADFHGTLNLALDYLGRVRQHNPASATQLLATEERIAAAASGFSQMTAEQSPERMLAQGSDAYFDQLTRSIEAMYAELFDTLHPAIDRMLQERAVRATQRAWLTVGLALLFLLLLGYLALASYLAVMRNIRHLTASLQAFAGGDLRQRVAMQARDTRDELQQIGGHFNAMADVIENLVETKQRDLLHQQQLNAQLRLADRVFEAAYEGISVTDVHGNILRVNPAFCEITGYNREELVGNNHRMLQSGRQSPAFYADMWRVLVQRGGWQGEIWNRRKDGVSFAEMLRISALRDDDGVVRQYVGLFSDITESKAYQERLERQAHHDALTGLPNRILLTDRIEQAVARARRTGENLAVVGLDLDGFKAINDVHGHEGGDRLLIEISQRLQMSLRTNDTVARLGGDEFVLILADVSAKDDCERTLMRVLGQIAQPVNLGEGATAKVSGSIGYTLFPEDDADPDTLLRHADLAMYLAKQNGKNRFARFDFQHDQRQRGHADVLAQIEQGLARGEFALHVQPKVNLATGQPIGAEALIRWNHPERGLLAPAEFLPVIFNHAALSLRFDAWVLLEGMRILQAWRLAGLDLGLSLNMSSHQLQSPGFGEQIAQALDAARDIAPHQLEIEIIESAALDDLDRVVRLIAQCQALGVRFALDDFGTGYSTLTYLKQMGVDTLKIDRSFVHDMERDASSMAIVQGIIALADAFHCEVVAEGVETWSQARWLQERGCLHIQGYVVARPMPAGDMPAWVAGFVCPSLYPLAADSSGPATMAP